MAKIDIIKLGYYSPSQNGVIVSAAGCAPCVCGGGKGHDVDVPKILIDWNDDQSVLHYSRRAKEHKRRQENAPNKCVRKWNCKLLDGANV